MYPAPRSLVIGSVLCLSALSPSEARAGMSCVGTLLTDPGTETPPGASTFVHKVTVTNKCNSCTTIDNVHINAFRGASLFVTPSYNPGGVSGGVLNPHAIAVGYADNPVNRWSIFNEDSSHLPEGAKFNVRAEMADWVPAILTGGHFYLEHIAVGQPNATLSVTANWSGPAYEGMFYYETPGVRYDTSRGQWEIFNLSGAPMASYAGFNVRVESAIVHQVASTTSFSPIMNPLALVADAEVFVTPNAQTGTWTAGDHHVAVKYQGGRWGLFFQDLDSYGNPVQMPAGATYNVVIVRPSYMIASAPSYNYAYINDSLANDNPEATVFVTANGAGTDDPHCTGVWYDAWQGRWSVFNEDYMAMPAGAAFNVKVANGFVHVASSPSGVLTYIDNPMTNGNPWATLSVTQNWNPDSRGYGVYNSSCIGVFFDTYYQKWAIFNEDLSSMPTGAAFNVLVENAVVATSKVSGPSSFSFSDPAVDGDSSALLQATPNYNPGGLGGTLDSRPVGVKYNASKGQWSVYHPDGSPVSYGASYNIAGH